MFYLATVMPNQPATLVPSNYSYHNNKHNSNRRTGAYVSWPGIRQEAEILILLSLHDIAMISYCDLFLPFFASRFRAFHQWTLSQPDQPLTAPMWTCYPATGPQAAGSKAKGQSVANATTFNFRKVHARLQDTCRRTPAEPRSNFLWSSLRNRQGRKETRERRDRKIFLMRCLGSRWEGDVLFARTVGGGEAMGALVHG